MNEGFVGERSKLYRECLKEYPDARLEDINAMKKYLKPMKGERILEVGAGSGFFSGVISEMIEESGKLVVSDPSDEQLDGVKDLKKTNIKIVQQGAENLNLSENYFDAVWSFGAMHHVFQKQKSLEDFKRVLKKDGRIIIVDVFSDSKLAKHFDEQVAKYCVTGHEVSFWSREYAESICFLAGLEKPRFYVLNQKWKFKTKEDIGIFLYKTHAMTKTTPEECLKGAERILGVEKRSNLYELNWPMTLFVTC